MSDKNLQNNIENLLNTRDTRDTRDIEDTRDTIIHFNIEDINKDYIKSNSRLNSSQVEKVKQLNISPIVRRTPNTKADIIIQKIYTNRKNVIKNYQNTSTNLSLSIDKINNSSKIDNSQNNDKLYNYENDTNLVNNDTIPLSRIINKNIDESPSIKESSSSDGSPDKSVTSISDDSVNGDVYRENIFDRNTEKRKRRYYRTIKLKKDKNEKIQPLNINEIETLKQSPSESPRDITQDLWNDSVENYYIEFQKLCKEEAEKYKYLSHRNELISNLLKFILLISGCFTFTLSISTPGTLFMSTTTTVSSCLTAIITSLTGFFQFDKKSEIQYNIYRELDKLYNTISLEMLKPTYMRPDPYEYILSLRNRRDELLKTLQKK